MNTRSFTPVFGHLKYDIELTETASLDNRGWSRLATSVVFSIFFISRSLRELVQPRLLPHREFPESSCNRAWIDEGRMSSLFLDRNVLLVIDKVEIQRFRLPRHHDSGRRKSSRRLAALHAARSVIGGAV